MTEVYWLQRLANVGYMFGVGFWVCVLIACALVIIHYFLWVTDELDCDSDDCKRMLRWVKRFGMVFAFFTVGAVIVPTEKDIMAIYGIGGVVDYVKESDKAKELPDKVVDALTRYVDAVEKDSKENK